jgi:hypothetical protein
MHIEYVHVNCFEDFWFAIRAIIILGKILDLISCESIYI